MVVTSQYQFFGIKKVFIEYKFGFGVGFRPGTLELEAKLCFALDEFFTKGEGNTNDLEGFIYLSEF